jgi:radical SAM-linked protein
VRIRFQKGGDLRFVSHHDLMQCFERMLHRAALPYHATQGFNPKPRLVFALSLALGVLGREEVVELELDAEIPPEEVHERLARQAPAGLAILNVRRIDRRAGAQVRRACYRLPLPAERTAGLQEAIAALLATPELRVARGAWRLAREGGDLSTQYSRLSTQHSAPARTPERDIRPYLRDLQLRGDALEMDFWVTPTGTARPEEILALLGLGDLLADGAVLERVTLELHDETDATEAAPQALEGTGPRAEAGALRPRPTPLVPGPLAFES